MERIYVTVRVRPLSVEDSKTSPWKISANSIFLTNNQAKFEFDKIFGEDCYNEDVYIARTKEIVASAVRGFNGTVFAYGQTSSGKTHTMRGSAAEPGIIPLAVHDLFNSIQEDVCREFLVRMSYMEIYNEEINDLLAPEHGKLQIHESLERGIYVAGLKEEIVTSPEQVLDFMNFGESHRHIGQTNMNVYSSRSHTIFRMVIESREKLEDGDDVNSCDAVRVSVLNLVDLAGSERAAKTGAEGMRLKEGSHINKSLMTLGTVIKKLSEGAESQGGHVPYRDSKLTRILQPALGGNANTAIICNITLAAVHTDETKSSLQFASRALRVKNCACVNEILTDAALLKRQRKEIEELRSKLLSSHSEHLEDEILNLRNTLLQSELEKERIALELEEEKKEKALRERRLAEQAKRIANLSSLVLCSERTDKSTNTSKSKRRETWCPGPFSKSYDTEVSPTNEEANNGESNSCEVDANLPLPFEKLMQENEISKDSLNFNDRCDEFSLPDAHALLHVTSRRKMNYGAKKAFVQEFKDDDEDDFDKSTSFDPKNLTFRESEAIHVIKQLENEVGSVKMENAALHRNMDTAIELVGKQGVPLAKNNDEEALSFIKISEEIHDLATEFDESKNLMDNGLFFIKDILANFTGISETIRGFRSSASEDMVYFESVISDHIKVERYLTNKVADLEQEKTQLQNQIQNHQKHIQELKLEMSLSERTMEDRCSQYELEKDELLVQVLSLQKEVSSLQSSTLAKEKETLRKELEKTKARLKDTESKFKNSIQDKTKLEAEKMQAEREVKRLIGQRAILERDISKRDSNIDRRNSKLTELTNPKVIISTQEQQSQAEYKKLEVLVFEMEDEIASLHEALLNAANDNEVACVKNQELESEVNALKNSLNEANAEIVILKQDIVKLEQKLHDSESHQSSIKATLDMLTKEKIEIEMQVADALLEMEVEKSIREKAATESNESTKFLNSEISRLSSELVKMKGLLETSKEECRLLQDKLLLAVENLEKGNDCSSIISLENAQIEKESEQLNCHKCINASFKFEELLSRYQHSCIQIEGLQAKLHLITQERDRLTFKLKEDEELDLLNDYQNLEIQFLMTTVEREVLLFKTEELKEFVVQVKIDELQSARTNTEELEKQLHNEAIMANKEKTKLRMQLRYTQTKLDMFRRRYKDIAEEKKLMNTKFEEASKNYKEQLRWYGNQVLQLKKQLVDKN